jgi:hypothetical protein
MTNPVSATTGHSRTEERKVAKSLYLAIGAAILVGIFVFLAIGQKKELDPARNTAPATTESGSTADPATTN